MPSDCETDLRLSKPGHFRFCLILEERVVKFLIVDIDLAHLGLYPFTSLLFQTHARFLFLDCIPLICDTGIGDPG
jgi:hypothetical protein